MCPLSSGSETRRSTTSREERGAQGAASPRPSDAVDRRPSFGADGMRRHPCSKVRGHCNPERACAHSLSESVQDANSSPRQNPPPPSQRPASEIGLPRIAPISGPRPVQWQGPGDPAPLPGMSDSRRPVCRTEPLAHPCLSEAADGSPHPAPRGRCRGGPLWTHAPGRWARRDAAARGAAWGGCAEPGHGWRSRLQASPILPVRPGPASLPSRAPVRVVTRTPVRAVRPTSESHVRATRGQRSGSPPCP